METFTNDNKKFYCDKTINQNGNLKLTLSKIADGKFEFNDGDKIRFYIEGNDKNVQALYFANHDDFNSDQYILIDEVILVNLKNEVDFTEFFKKMEAKLNEIRDAHRS